MGRAKTALDYTHNRSRALLPLVRYKRGKEKNLYCARGACVRIKSENQGTASRVDTRPSVDQCVDQRVDRVAPGAIPTGAAIFWSGEGDRERCLVLLFFFFLSFFFFFFF
jgi:hypothetical protein